MQLALKPFCSRSLEFQTFELSKLLHRFLNVLNFFKIENSSFKPHNLSENQRIFTMTSNMETFESHCCSSLARDCPPKTSCFKWEDMINWYEAKIDSWQREGKGRHEVKSLVDSPSQNQFTVIKGTEDCQGGVFSSPSVSDSVFHLTVFHVQILKVLDNFFVSLSNCSHSFLRINLSMGIVAMTENRTINHENGTQTYEQYFDWDSKQQGIVLSSFFYGYICTQVGTWVKFCDFMVIWRSIPVRWRLRCVENGRKCRKKLFYYHFLSLVQVYCFRFWD